MTGHKSLSRLFPRGLQRGLKLRREASVWTSGFSYQKRLPSLGEQAVLNELNDLFRHIHLWKVLRLEEDTHLEMIICDLWKIQKKDAHPWRYYKRDLKNYDWVSCDQKDWDLPVIRLWPFVIAKTSENSYSKDFQNHIFSMLFLEAKRRVQFRFPDLTDTQWAPWRGELAYRIFKNRVNKGPFNLGMIAACTKKIKSFAWKHLKSKEAVSFLMAYKKNGFTLSEMIEYGDRPELQSWLGPFRKYICLLRLARPQNWPSHPSEMSAWLQQQLYWSNDLAWSEKPKKTIAEHLKLKTPEHVFHFLNSSHQMIEQGCLPTTYSGFSYWQLGASFLKLATRLTVQEQRFLIEICNNPYFIPRGYAYLNLEPILTEYIRWHCEQKKIAKKEKAPVIGLDVPDLRQLLSTISRTPWNGEENWIDFLPNDKIAHTSWQQKFLSHSTQKTNAPKEPCVVVRRL